MGGVGGHMAHLSEDLDLTFNDIIDVLGKVAGGEIKSATEKVDGQNLFLTVNADREIRTARNAGDIKKGGMTTDEYVSKWIGHPAETAFTNGFRAVTAALRKLSPETLEDLFSDGLRYVNMEIMYPKNPNIILYSAPHVVLHGLQYFSPTPVKDMNPEEKAELERLQKVANQKFPELAAAVDGAQEQVGEEMWTINGPKIVALKKLADGSALEEVTQKIESFAAPVGSDAKLKDYVGLTVGKYAEQVGLPPDTTKDLLLVMLEPDEAKRRGLTVTSLKKGLPKELQSVVSKLGTKTNSRKYIASILQPLEIAISDFAIEVLRGVKSFFVDEHDKEIVRMQNELQKSIIYLKNLQDSGDVKMGELVDKQLAKLGDIENLASSMEGVVFEYPPGSDKIYKLTGAFAMSNQIIGRARRSGMTERLSGNFVIRISKDQEVSKTLAEWLQEIEEAKHTYTKLPQMVYDDIIGGGAIVDLVEQENALQTMYNTVITYINSLNEEEELDLQIVDSEAADPVGSGAGVKTVAVIPGAFKPPHRGHAKMVKEHYASIADKVIVLISSPLKGQRTFGAGDTPIISSHANAIWNVLLAGAPNIQVVESSQESASPMTAAYAMVGKEEERAKAADALEIKPEFRLNPGDNVILGASTKDGDWKRWRGASKYVGGGIDGDLNLVPPEQSAAPPVYHSEDYMGVLNSDENKELRASMPSVKAGKKPEEFHASDMRHLLGLVPDSVALDLLRDFTDDQNGTILPLLGVDTGTEDPLEEEASMAQGAVGGYAAPFGRSMSAKPKKKKKKQKEYIDLSLVDEVMELLIERGIVV